MKKRIVSIILGVICFVGFANVRAEKCDVDELYDLQTGAAKIKVEKTVETGIDETISCGDDPECDQSHDYYKIHILNLSENYRLEIRNDFNNEIIRIDYDDVKDGEATFDWNHIMVITNFTIDVYSNNSKTCVGNKITTLFLTTPRKNSYSNYSICEGQEDNELCQEYVEYEEIEYNEFYKKLASDIEEKNIEKDEPIYKKILSSYWTWITLGVLIIGGSTIVVIRKKAVK